MYYNLGRLPDAEPLFKRALAIYEKVNGAEHANTASALLWLANTYSALAKYTEAEPLYKRSLAIYEKVNGPEHPETALPLFGLARVYFLFSVMMKLSRSLSAV